MTRNWEKKDGFYVHGAKNLEWYLIKVIKKNRALRTMAVPPTIQMTKKTNLIKVIFMTKVAVFI